MNEGTGTYEFPDKDLSKAAMKSADQIFGELSDPFAPNELEWKVQTAGHRGDKQWAMLLCYVDNRAIQNRFDTVLGANWMNSFRHIDGGTICRLSLFIEGRWIHREDGAGESDIETVKGGMSNSMKRAAVMFGVGRYLYNLETTFVDVIKIKPDGEYGLDYIKVDFQPKSGEKVSGYIEIPPLPEWALPKGFKHIGKSVGTRNDAAVNAKLEESEEKVDATKPKKSELIKRIMNAEKFFEDQKTEGFLAGQQRAITRSEHGAAVLLNDADIDGLNTYLDYLNSIS